MSFASSILSCLNSKRLVVKFGNGIKFLFNMAGNIQQSEISIRKQKPEISNRKRQSIISHSSIHDLVQSAGNGCHIFLKGHELWDERLLSGNLHLQMILFVQVCQTT